MSASANKQPCPDTAEHFETVPVDKLAARLVRLFVAAGLSKTAASQLVEGLIDADLEGLSSHGVMQAEIYLQRLRAGSVSRLEEAELVLDRDAVAVLDAKHMFGHLAADQAMRLAVERAERFGIAAVAVRHAFHFGSAGRYALAASKSGCIGIAMCNTPPLMPAPGGAERLVGNNPLAVAIPTASGPPLCSTWR